MAQFQILAHHGTAKIQIAILHTDVIATVCIVLNGERRCGARREDVEFLYDNLYVASRKIGVLTLTLVYCALYLNAEFASELRSASTQFAVVRIVKDQLCDTITVAQVGKNHASHLSYALYPSGKCYHLAGI